MLYAKKLKFDEAMVCIEEAQKHEPDNVEISRIKRELESFISEFNRVFDQIEQKELPLLGSNLMDGINRPHADRVYPSHDLNTI